MNLQSARGTALSGMQAAVQRLGSASHNVANLGTEGFRRELASQNSSGAGVTVSFTRAAVPGDALAQDLVAQRVALIDFKAGMQVFKAGQEMLGSLLDLRA